MFPSPRRLRLERWLLWALPSVFDAVLVVACGLDGSLEDAPEPALSGEPEPEGGDALTDAPLTPPDAAGDGDAREPEPSPRAAVAEQGAPCTAEGQLACEGHAQRYVVQCDEGRWVARAPCAEDERCDTRLGASAGSCLPLVPECAGKSAGAVVCAGLERSSCGVDLVTSSPLLPCAYRCSAGSCKGECHPGASECVGDGGLRRCTAGALWSPVEACPSSAPRCEDGACTAWGPGGTCHDAELGRFRPIVEPRPGQLVITEVLANPTNEPSPAPTDATREWFEVVALAAVDLNGVQLDRERDTAPPTMLERLDCVHLSAGQHALFARSVEPAANRGLPRVTASFPFTLVDTRGELRLLDRAGLVLDAVSWRSATSGVARQLSAGTLSAEANDDDRAWCAATTLYNGVDRGTPGAPNDVVCP